MSGRLYGDHVDGNPIPSQERLLTMLEDRGYETDSSHILTDDLGVPLTFLLLLARDAVEGVAQEERQVLALAQQDVTFTTADLRNRYPGVLYTQEAGDLPPDQTWTGRGSCYSTTPTISGVTSFAPQTIIFPDSNPPAPLNAYISSSSPDIVVYRGHIEVRDPASGSVSSVGLMKHLFMALEMFYASMERLKAEREALADVSHMAVARLPDLPRTLSGHCTRRGSVVHRGHVALRMSGDGTHIRLGNDALTESLQAGIREAGEYIEQVYSQWVGLL